MHVKCMSLEFCKLLLLYIIFMYTFGDTCRTNIMCGKKQRAITPKIMKSRFTVDVHYTAPERSLYVCWVVVVLRFLTTHSDIPIRRRDIQSVSFFKWLIVQETGAPNIHHKPCSLTCPVYSTTTQPIFFSAKNQLIYISF